MLVLSFSGFTQQHRSFETRFRAERLVLGETYVALAADHLVAVVLGGKGLERGLNDTTTETEDQVESGLL